MDESTADEGAPGPDSETGPELTARIAIDGVGPIECTVWPADAPDDENTTAWITARGDSFVSLAAMR